jgi:hypothetical protein
MDCPQEAAKIDVKAKSKTITILKVAISCTQRQTACRTSGIHCSVSSNIVISFIKISVAEWHSSAAILASIC